VQTQSDPAPLCSCGCGERTKWNPRYKRWGKFIFKHAHGKTKNAARQAKLRPVVEGEPPVTCLCGCGKPVVARRGRWSDYHKGHQNIGKKGLMSKKGLLALSERMKVSNPMFNQVTAEKAHRTRGKNQGPSKLEAAFTLSIEKWNLPISFVGDGSLWVDRRNPDYRVNNQDKLVELTSLGIRRSDHLEERTVEGYGLQTIEHYMRSNWRTIVVFKHNHRSQPPLQLKEILENFISSTDPECGIWHFNRWIPVYP